MKRNVLILSKLLSWKGWAGVGVIAAVILTSISWFVFPNGKSRPPEIEPTPQIISSNTGGARDCLTFLRPTIKGNLRMADDESQIRNLIELEVDSALSLNANQAVSIYTEDSKVIDAVSGRVWEGCEAIKRRYETIAKYLIFTSLNHKISNIEYSADAADVDTIVHADYVFQYTVDAATRSPNWITLRPFRLPQEISGAKWHLTRDDNGWRVASFTYGLPPPEL